MKPIEIPKPQLAALLRGEPVTVYLEGDKNLSRATYVEIVEGRAYCYISSGTDLQRWLLGISSPPHSKGDVLWVQRDSWVCERCKVVRWEEAEVLCWECNGPEAETRDAEMVFVPADQMPEQAARAWVRVEDVRVETEAGMPYAEGRAFGPDKHAWALTLAPTEKP